MHFFMSVTYVDGEGSVNRRHFLTVLFNSYSHELQLNHCILGLHNVNHAERSRFASAIKSGPSCRELSLASLSFRLEDVTSVLSESHEPNFFTMRGTFFSPTTRTLKLPSPTYRTVSAIRRKFADYDLVYLIQYNIWLQTGRALGYSRQGRVQDFL